MKIADAQRTAAAHAAYRRRKTASGGGPFAAWLDEAGAPAEDPVAPLAAAATVDFNPLLSAQEISEDEAQNRKLAQEGKAALDSLEELRRALLGGVIPPSVLIGLGQRIEFEKQKAADPRLLAVIEEIELRVAVELAKLDQMVQSEAGR